MLSPHLARIRASEVLKRLPTWPVIGAEIGVAFGQMSAELLKRDDLILYMVDSWLAEKDQPLQYKATGDIFAFMTAREVQNIRLVAMRYTSFAGERAKMLWGDSVAMAKAVEPNGLDFVFIDGDHSYEGCRRDIAAWRPCLKDHGLLCGHDYESADHRLEGVTRAVDELAAENQWIVETGDNDTWFVEIGEGDAFAA